MLYFLALGGLGLSNRDILIIVVLIAVVLIAAIGLLYRASARGAGGIRRGGRDKGPGRFDVEGTDFTSKGDAHTSVKAASPDSAAAKAGREGMVVTHVTRDTKSPADDA